MLVGDEVPILRCTFFVLMTFWIMCSVAVWASPDASAPTPDGDEQQTQALKGCAPQTLKVVLDVGHTPEAPGATSARGTKEYWFNLHLAERIKAALVTNGFTDTKVIMVHGVGEVQLARRVEEANAAGPLYTAIRRDRSLPESPFPASIAGCEVRHNPNVHFVVLWRMKAMNQQEGPDFGENVSG